MSKRLLLIINPRSGKTKKKEMFSGIEKVITDSGWDTDTVYTEHRGHATELAENAGGYDRVVCVGGDGTLNEVYNGLMKLENRPEIGYIPAGSTNDFAKGIGLPASYKRSASLAAGDNVCPIDVGAFKPDGEEAKYFSYVASFGMFTKVSYATDQGIKNKLGHMAYIFEGIKSIADLESYKPFRLRVETEDTVLEQEYIFGAISNSTSLGGVVKLDKKRVHVDDGVFELILIRKPKNFIDIGDTVGQLMNKRYRADRIVFAHTDKVKLTAEKPLDWTLDGEYAGAVASVLVDVNGGALNFVRPEGVRRKPFLRKKRP